ncbi:MAG: CoA transferase [Myxococcales bacterium]|nr:CoA transferase [Myxococcales bacterium]
MIPPPPPRSEAALAGLRVLELGQLIAGPFAAAYLAGFGAEVIKIEDPARGDPLRSWRKLYQGTSLWWRLMARNKRSVAIDLRRPEGRALVRRLIVEGHVDVVIENFRPGRMEAWGLGYEALAAENPRLVMARISGYGQDGPRAQEPGFANIAEAVAGLRYLTGEPGKPPLRSQVSLGDTIAGLHAAFGIMVAIHERDVVGSGRGQVVDVALTESIFAMLESLLPEYDVLGHVRERAGSRLEGVVPTGTYACGDGVHVVIGANSDSMFRRLMRVIGRGDLADDPALATNAGRVAHEGRIDAAIAAYTAQRPASGVLEALRAAEIAVGPIQSIAEIARDPQFIARGAFESATLEDGRPMQVPAVVPRLSATPGATRWLGPALGVDTRAILGGWLGLADEALRSLAEGGVIGGDAAAGGSAPTAS